MDFVAAEYHISPMEALTRTPLSLMLMLSAACHQRNGGKFGGPDYVERDLFR